MPGVKRHRPIPRTTRRKQAKAKARHLLHRLRYNARPDDPTAPITRTLSRCNVHHPCSSGVCFRCNRSLQTDYAAAVRRVTTNHPDQNLYAITIILPTAYLKPGELHLFDIDKHRRSLRHYLGKADCRLLFGVVEFDFVEHHTDRYPAGWLPHFHGLVAVANRQELAALRQRFTTAIAATEAVRVPVKIKEWDGSSKWPNYCSKISLKRRVGFDDLLRHNKKTGQTRICRGTKTRKLRALELHELAACLHRLPLDRRLFACRAQWRTTGQCWHLIRPSQPSGPG